MSLLTALHSTSSQRSTRSLRTWRVASCPRCRCSGSKSMGSRADLTRTYAMRESLCRMARHDSLQHHIVKLGGQLEQLSHCRDGRRRIAWCSMPLNRDKHRKRMFITVFATCPIRRGDAGRAAVAISIVALSCGLHKPTSRRVCRRVIEVAILFGADRRTMTFPPKLNPTTRLSSPT